MIEIHDFFYKLTLRVEEMTMSAGLKTFLMAIGAAAWGGLVTYFHSLAVGTPFAITDLTNLWHVVVAAVVPAIIAFFMNPPTTPTPPAPPAA